MKSDWVKILFLLIFITSTLVYFLLKENQAETYLNNYHTNFQGYVVKKTSLSQYSNSHYGIIRLKLVKTDKDYLDERNLPYYFCAINNGYAEIGGGNFDAYEINDLVKTDSDSKTISIYRDNKLIKVFRIIPIDNFTTFGQQVRKQHEIY